ncbi:ATP-dependent DNA helicase [Mycena chlorophos]|uniref:ATP-dependent DNA helicase n=1 Tax=Mycena chlorophos TaxID=658473 RepID=A0A8H6TMX1_MYCCL|nr:ATP-dependent DNA helicase [Mycena chlorophos]
MSTSSAVNLTACDAHSGYHVVPDDYKITEVLSLLAVAMPRTTTPLEDEDVDPPADFADTLRTFTVNQILGLLFPISPAPRSSTRTRPLLITYCNSLSREQKLALFASAQVQTGTKRPPAPPPSPPLAPHRPPKRRRLPTLSEAVHSGNLEDLINGPFLRTASSETVQACISRFIDRTGNAALAKGTCMACARRLFLAELQQCAPDDIPNIHLLIPTHPHPAHFLYNSALLHKPAVTAPRTYICCECRARLLKFERPPLSLANNMWVGEIPFVLEILTLPERLLIGIAGGKGWDRETINSGLRGNVSTYRLNTKEISEMITGNLMPRPLGLLTAVIAVTFVGAKNVPLLLLPDIFEVRRQRVADALLWLKANNPLYADVEISADRLSSLPEGGVPPEIALAARYNPDASVIEREHAGYVPMDEDPGGDGDQEPDEAEERQPPVQHLDMHAQLNSDPEEPALEVYEPAVIPLQAHGSVDLNGEALTDGELFMHAVDNLHPGQKKRDYAVRKGSGLINEYPRVKDGQRFVGEPGDANHILGAFPCLFPYGLGGFEVDRDINVTYEAHAKWALCYDDGRFRRDIYCIFLLFNVISRRRVARSASMQINRASFVANQTAFLRLTPADFRQASEEEAKKIPITNPVISALRRQITAVRARVMGTDESRIAIRAQDITFYITLYIAKRQIQAANASALLAKSLEIKQRLDARDAARQQSIKDANKRLLQQCTNTLSRQQEFSAPEVDTPCRIETTPNGTFVLRDQLKEYQDRGLPLSDMNLFDYFTLTYDGLDLPEPTDHQSAAGRTPSERVPYLPDSGRAGCRVLRNHGQEINLHFIGRWFPRADGPHREYYCAQMLLLLKAWRTLPDLHGPHPTFSSAFDAFMLDADTSILRTIENIQYFYECSDRAADRRAAESLPTGVPPNADVEMTDAGEAEVVLGLTEDDITLARANRYAARELLFGQNAILIAQTNGIFSSNYVTAPPQPSARRATATEMSLYRDWGVQVAAFTRSADFATQNALHLGHDLVVANVQILQV